MHLDAHSRARQRQFGCNGPLEYRSLKILRAGTEFSAGPSAHSRRSPLGSDSGINMNTTDLATELRALTFAFEPAAETVCSHLTYDGWTWGHTTQSPGPTPTTRQPHPCPPSGRLR